MKSEKVREKVKRAVEIDPSIICPKAKVTETLGSDRHYLNDVLGLTKSDLIRLERLGLAVKARYVVQDTGQHRIRWILFEEALYATY